MESIFTNSLTNYKVLHFAEIDSTNEYAWTLVTNNNPTENVVIIADNQTLGKGQYGRKWESSAGKNITMTTIQCHKLNVNVSFFLTVATSLAITRVLEKASSQRISIKWPNDIYVNDQKIAGILIKNKIQGNAIINSIIGMGVNINQKKFGVSLSNPTSLNIIANREFDLAAIVADILNRLSNNLQNIYDGKFQELLKQYNLHLYRKSKWNKFLLKGEEILLNIQYVNEKGGLVLKKRNGDLIEVSSALEYII